MIVILNSCLPAGKVFQDLLWVVPAVMYFSSLITDHLTIYPVNL